MFIDHKRKFAAASASFCVRFTMASALACGLLGASLAHADGDGPNGQRRDQQQPQQHQQNAPRGEQPRSSDARQLDPRAYEARAEEQRRAMQDASRNAEMSRRVGRMTPDERRDLRRQINEVSQDLYAVPPRR